MGFVLEPAEDALSKMRGLSRRILRSFFFQSDPNPEKPSKNSVFRVPFHLAAQSEIQKTLGPIHLTRHFTERSRHYAH